MICQREWEKLIHNAAEQNCQQQLLKSMCGVQIVFPISLVFRHIFVHAYEYILFFLHKVKRHYVCKLEVDRCAASILNSKNK